MKHTLEDSCCPFCGSSEVEKDMVANSWWCRDCGGSAEESPPDIRELIQKGLTPAEAVDWAVCVCRGISQTRWADERDRDQSTISKNIAQADIKLRHD